MCVTVYSFCLHARAINAEGGRLDLIKRDDSKCMGRGGEGLGEWESDECIQVQHKCDLFDVCASDLQCALRWTDKYFRCSSRIYVKMCQLGLILLSYQARYTFTVHVN
jgi:hypothetical protein